MSTINIAEVISVDENEMILQNESGEILYMKKEEVGGINKPGKCESLLGIPIKYIVTDSKNEKKYCSRRLAMEVTFNNEKSSLIKDAKKKARVHKILKKGLIVDCCGLETFIPVERCTNVFVDDLYELGDFELGDEIDVFVESFENNNLELKVVQKDINTSIYKEGGQYVAEVVSVQEDKIFVKLPVGNVAMLCRNPRWKRAVQAGDKVKSTIERINHDEKRLWGYITAYVKRGGGN